MKYFKRVILPILWIPLLCVSLFASPSLEDMAIKAEYIGVVNITKVENISYFNRHTVEIINTIKGDVPAGGKLIIDISQEDASNKTIKTMKPLHIGESVLVFLITYSWDLEKHLHPIANRNVGYWDRYYGIWLINEDEKIDGLDKQYTISQIKNIINACNSSKFNKLKNRAMSYDEDQYVDKLKLYQDLYKICPTTSVKYNIEDLNKNTLVGQIKEAGLPTLLLETLFFLLFFAMGYYGKWRWTGMLFMVYMGLVILVLPRNIPFVTLLSFLLPFVSYGLGILLYRAKKGTWLRDKVKEEMAQSFLEGEDEDGSYVVWEYERTVFSRATMIVMAVLSLVEILLIANADKPGIPAPLVLIPLIFLIPTLIFALVTFNRLRYQYGCYDKGYAYGINDSRMKFISFLSVATGAADRNPTLAGAGLISYGIGSIRREWSSVEWCRYDDDKKIIVISHGCCKSDKLYASDRSYNGLKAIVMKAIGEKCTGINKKRPEGSEDVK